MANTLSVMLRNVVSKKRRRYTEGGFNLDLAYICDNIIAMGYPEQDMQKVFRNPMTDVCKFFQVTHPEHYKVYNLRSEKVYDVNMFHGRVSVYAFEDHNPPTIELIEKFCNDVDHWLKADPNNVAAIHCKAGKGRTGTMICCYLLHSGIKTTAEDALAFYGEKRTMNNKGVTIPSQRRYVQYYERLIRSKLKYERRTLQLCEIRFSPATTLQNQGCAQCLISTMDEIDCTETRTSKETWTKVTVRDMEKFPIDFRRTFTLELDLSVTGDVKVELKKLFHFWFNTYFVCDTADYEGEGEDMKLIYTLSKWELDDAHKDKEHKVFSEDFKVQLIFKLFSSHTRNNGDGNEIPQLRQHNNHNNHVNSLTHNSHNILLSQQFSYGKSPIPTSSRTGDPAIDTYCFQHHRKTTSLPFPPPGNCGSVVAGGSDYVQLNQMQNLMQRHHQQQQQQQQQQKRNSEPTPSVNPDTVNRSNSKNHNNSSHHHHQSLQQQQAHNHHQHQHLLHHEQQQQQQKVLQQQQHQLQLQQLNVKSSSGSNLHNNTNNSNSSSSSSISSQTSSSSSSVGIGCSNGGVDGGGGGGGVAEEEDWESGESSTTTFITTTTTPTTTSYFPYKPSISSQNDDDDDDNNSKAIVKHDDDDDNDDSGVAFINSNSNTTITPTATSTSITTTLTTTDLRNSKTKPLTDDAIVPLSKNQPNNHLIPFPSSLGTIDDSKLHNKNHPLPLAIPLSSSSATTNGLNQAHPSSLYITQMPLKSHHMNFIHKKCCEPPCSDSVNQKLSATTKCSTTRSKFLKLINSQRFKAKNITPSGMGSSLTINSAGLVSASAATQNQLLKKKKAKSKNIPPLKTFQWLHNYFRIDPDFHENLSQQTTIPMGRRNSAGSVSSRNHLNSVGSASGGIGRAGSVEKGFRVGSLESRVYIADDDDYNKDNSIPLERCITVPAPANNDSKISHYKSLGIIRHTTDIGGDCFGTSPVEKTLNNAIDIGSQLSSISPAKNKVFTCDTDSDRLNAAAILTKNNSVTGTLKCDENSPNAAVATSVMVAATTVDRLPRVELSQSPTFNERTTSIGSSNMSNSMDHLCVPYANMYLQTQSSLEDGGDTEEVYLDHDDYYSSICDNQLSFNNSPCKSPRSLSDILDLKPAITHRTLLSHPESSSPIANAATISPATTAVNIVSNRNKPTNSSDGIVIAKPVESHSIGFKVDQTSSVTTTPTTTTRSTSQVTQKYNTNVNNCGDVMDLTTMACNIKSTSAKRKSPVGSILNLIIMKSDNKPIYTVASTPSIGDDGGSCGGGDVGDNTDSGTGDLSLNNPRASGSTSSSSGYCGASEGSQSVSSTSSGVVDTISSSGTAFSLERNSLDSNSAVVINSKKKLSLPTPEIEIVGEFGLTKNRSSSVSNNNKQSNISTLLASSSSSSSGSSIDNKDKHL